MVRGVPRSGNRLTGLPGPRLPLLCSNRPSFMIAPASSKLEVSRREPFEPKPTPLNKLARCFVVGLNIRLEPMQPLMTKCFRQNGTKSSLHMTTSVVRYESIVSKVPGTEYTPHNLIDVDHASELTILSADPVRDVCLVLQAFEVLFEFLYRPWWTGPMAVQFATPRNSSQKLTSPLRRGSFENGMFLHRTLG